MTNLLEVQQLQGAVNHGNPYTNGGMIVGPVTFSMQEQQNLAIVGSRGSGKSTLVDMVTGISKPTDGKIILDGQLLSFANYQIRCKLIRPVFPAISSFSPRLSIMETLEILLKLHTSLSSMQRAQEIFSTLDLVGLPPTCTTSRPQDLSCEKRQRLSLARALILKPRLVTLISVTEWLRGETQSSSQLINLLLELQQRCGCSYLYATEQLALARCIGDQILVMSQGAVVEQGAASRILTNPSCELTRKFIQNQQHPLWLLEEKGKNIRT